MGNHTIPLCLVSQNKEWIFDLAEPVASFPMHRQFEVIFIADSSMCCWGDLGMWPNLYIFAADSGDMVSEAFKLRSYGVYAGDIISVQIGSTEDAMATGGIEKFQLEASSTDGWFIERMYAKFGESFSEIDLFHVQTGTRGIWLDGEPFDSPSDYRNTPTIQYYNVSNSYTFYAPSSAVEAPLITVPPTSPTPTTPTPIGPLATVPPTPPHSTTPIGFFGQILNAIASLFEFLFGWLDFF